LYLKVGDKVPCDGRVLSLKTNSFCTDEGSLTGESATVSKHSEAVEPNSKITDKKNSVFAGTMVTNGGCYVLATATGPLTEIGMINSGVQVAMEEHSKTPLALKLDEFGDQLTAIIGVICVAVWVVSIPKFSNAMFGGSWAKGALYHAKIGLLLLLS
jgi:magnesium-transporting ATPase (P-type)